MSKKMYCPHCGTHIGNCGHFPGGLTDPTTISGTCSKCNEEYSVTCYGDCLDKEAKEDEQSTRPMPPLKK